MTTLSEVLVRLKASAPPLPLAQLLEIASLDKKLVARETEHFLLLMLRLTADCIVLSHHAEEMRAKYRAVFDVIVGDWSEIFEEHAPDVEARRFFLELVSAVQRL